MGKSKKKRQQKTTVFGSVEGDRETFFLDFLMELYQTEQNNVAFKGRPSDGGTADKITRDALRECCNRDKVFAWFDEDFECNPKQNLSNETKEQLRRFWDIKTEDISSFNQCPLGKLQERYNPNNKKPVLIVSQPVCVEAIILRALGKTLPVSRLDHTKKKEQVRSLKSSLEGLISAQDERQFYASFLTKERLENIKKLIPELNLLISMITK